MTSTAAPSALAPRVGRRGGLIHSRQDRRRETEAMVAGALRWVDRHLDEFDPFKEGRPFEMRHGQKLAELATMVHCYIELTGDAEGPEVSRMLGLLRSVQHNRELNDRLLRAPGELVLYCILYVVLRARGGDDPGMREVLQRAIDAGLLAQTERVVHRQMDVSLHLEWGGFDHSWPRLEELYSASILGQGPCPLYLDENAVYAVTHVLMFLYGFGLRKPTEGFALDIEGLGRTLSQLLIVACQERHWDLLAELLLCWDCAGLVPTAISERSWTALLSAQEPDGAIPGPESALPPGRSAADPPLGAFAHRYHTTLVGIIAGALHLHRPPPLQEPRRREPVRRRAAVSAVPVAAAARRARNWLCGLLETSQEVDRPEALGRILVGCWLCDSILGEEGSTVDRSLLDRELVQVALGLSAATDAPTADLARYALSFPLTASREQVEELAQRIQTATAYGARRLPPLPGGEWIPEMLIGFATHALRQYNLLGACRLLRSAGYLGAGTAAYREHLDFLCLHQRPEGPFGYFGPEERKIAGLAPAGFSADLDLYVPVTLSCLWALAECAPGGASQLRELLGDPTGA